MASLALRAADDFCSRVAALPRPGSLVVALFHSVHRNEAELRSGVLAPNQDVTLDDLRRFIEAALRAGYHPTSAAELGSAQSHGRRNLLLSFDDGYFNNSWVLPVLEEFHVPGLFFIATSHVLEHKAFWWDAAARALRGCGLGEWEIARALERLKRRHPRSVEREIRAARGQFALDPVGDLDRPFTPAELRDFARNRWVTLGNHTHEHVILPNCSGREMREQIATCQRELQAITGEAPKVFAYPNGDYSADAMAAVRESGLSAGFTVRPCRSSLPFSGTADALAIGRHLVFGGRDARAQCRQMGAAFVPGNILRTLRASPRA